MVVEPELYLAGPTTLIRRLRALPASLARAMLVGHNPGLAQLAIALASESAKSDDLRALHAKYPTAGLATFEISGSWDTLSPRNARLVRFLAPKDLA